MKKVTLSYLIKDVAGNAVVLIPTVNDCAVVGGILGDNEFLVLDGDVVLFVVIAGETDVACGHVGLPFCFYFFFTWSFVCTLLFKLHVII